ncbi:hypothetical protein [uncultured Aquimarina sp.]|uniref:hypothetical protein n=1 Tax=uncultured Aquimarina sp. TaxID=575652 RepID=UPI0026367483|nr:hypothetical protein [uncultured Aquimarina sp.]
MKHTTLLLSLVFAIFYSCSLQAQKSSAILIFKDGTELKGFGKIKSFGKVKFRKTKKDKAKKYKFDELHSVKIYEGGELNTYVYKSIKDSEFPKVLQLITEGKVTLYKIHTEGYYGTPNIGAGGFGGTGVGFGGGNYYSMNSYYVKRENEEEVTHLGSTHLFSKNFKKAASTYFKDCTSLVEKIQNKEFKKRHIREVVEYYNNDCH